MAMEDTDDEIEQHPWVQAAQRLVDQFTESMEQAAQRGDAQAVLLLSDGQAKAVWNLTLARGYLRSKLVPVVAGDRPTCGIVPHVSSTAAEHLVGFPPRSAPG